MTKDETLKLALDALERSVATCLDPYSHEQVKSRPEHFINKAITALRLAIDVENMVSESTYKEQLETKDEPVSCVECGADGGHALYCVACAEKFVKREWVGLTDEEIEGAYMDTPNFVRMAEFLENILREKNT